MSVLIPFAMLASSGLFAQVMPMNDVLLYGWWLQLMQQGQPIFGVAQPFVYPYLSQVPMWLALFLGGSAGILVGWSALVALANSTAIGFITNWGRGSTNSFVAAWFWITYLFLLGPSGIGRIDAIAAALAAIGVVLFLRGKVFGAIALFTFGAWIKIWPAALAIAAYIADKNRKAMAWAFSSVISVVFVLAFALGGNSNVFSFVFTQNNRGIQIESPIATFWLWAAKFNMGNAGIYYDKEIITNQVSGDWVSLISALMTPAMAIAIAITVWLGFKASRFGAQRNQLFAAIALTAVLDLIVFNKVGSPQFMSWIAIPVIAWILLEKRISKFLLFSVLAIAALTNLVYPVLYMDLMALGDLSLTVLTARNVLLIVLLVWANVQLGKLGKSIKQ